MVLGMIGVLIFAVTDDKKIYKIKKIERPIDHDLEFSKVDDEERINLNH